MPYASLEMRTLTIIFKVGIDIDHSKEPTMTEKTVEKGLAMNTILSSVVNARRTLRLLLLHRVNDNRRKRLFVKHNLLRSLTPWRSMMSGKQYVALVIFVPSDGCSIP